MDDKANESEKAPTFPDYMLDPDAVVSLPASMGSACVGMLSEAWTDCSRWKGQGQGGLAIWQSPRLHHDQADVGARYAAAVELIPYHAWPPPC